METKYKKQPIPSALRTKVWEKFIGDHIIGTCYVCDRQIRNDNYEVGHIIAESNEGEMKVDNLRPVCGPCNRSCGTKNTNNFKLMFQSDENVREELKTEEK